VSAAWIGVVGVLGGIALGAAVNIVGDHLRWQREDARLASEHRRILDDRRRGLAVDFASTVDELTSRLWSFVDHRGASAKNWRTDPHAQAREDRIEAVLSTFDRSYNELRILGIGDQVTAAADRLLLLCSELTSAAFADDLEQWEETWESAEIGEANGEFLAAVHDELGLARISRPLRRSTPRPAPLLRTRARPG
jgi:hypothetical protein